MGEFVWQTVGDNRARDHSFVPVPSLMTWLRERKFSPTIQELRQRHAEVLAAVEAVRGGGNEVPQEWLWELGVGGYGRDLGRLTK